MKKVIFTTLASLILFGCLSAEELSLDRADELINKAIEKAQSSNISIAVAIFDQHGNLKAFKRMDGAPLVSADTAKMKAFTSASVPISTQQLAELSSTDPNHAFAEIDGFLLLQGGLPIISSSGNHLGGIGIGGGSGVQDEECAQVALNFLSRDKVN